MKISYIVAAFLITFLGPGKSETVEHAPSVTPLNYVGKITTDTVILSTPQCYFGIPTNSSCNQTDCEIWLVPALKSSINNFDADQTNPDLLSLSPYPTAFTANGSKNYFLTKVGLLKDFLCSSAFARDSGSTYFRVGSEGSCTTTNCNGVLPDGSTVNFKYLVLDPANKAVLSETKWSDDISLYTSQNPDAIDDSLPGRSAAMVVITAILSVAMFFLLVLLVTMLILALCWGEKEPIQVLGSLRIPQYDTHHFKDPAPHVNPSYEHDQRGHPIFNVPSPIKLQEFD
ncbi:hypothetical protein AALO_G00021330 [Alosa alosa]|uniref:Uncharacterized protein n=1 Tax=Alosa alosa TaxID=278164 RepID=A0AAV6H9R6_9TELE|nr:uroplakin-3b [Alosa alosa]KAG5283950.1 hypothetical protein AALO_G00021330 [Alosa alosa]